MPFVTYIAHDGVTTRVDVPVGDSVMQGAQSKGLPGIVAECGGGLACATCHCYVDAAWISRVDPPTEAERQMLECTAEETQPGSRLSCQVAVTDALDGLIVRLPKSQF